MPAPRPHSRWGTALFVLSLMQTSRRAEGILQIQPHLELVELLPLPAELWEKPRRQAFRRDRRFPSLSWDRIHRGARSTTRGRSAYAGALRREYLAARGRTHDGLIMVRREHFGSPFQSFPTPLRKRFQEPAPLTPRSANFPQLVLLDRQPPRRVLPAEPDAPVERPGNDLLRDRLAVAAHVLHLVRRALADGVLGDLGAHRDPVDPLRQREAAVRLDRQLVACRMELVDQLAVGLKRRLAAGEDHPIAALRERLEVGQDLVQGHPAARLELGVAVEAVCLHRAGEVAPGEPQEEVGRARAYPLALEAVEDLVHQVPVHALYSNGRRPSMFLCHNRGVVFGEESFPWSVCGVPFWWSCWPGRPSLPPPPRPART